MVNSMGEVVHISEYFGVGEIAVSMKDKPVNEVLGQTERKHPNNENDKISENRG